MAVVTYLSGSIATLLSTELNSLANNAMSAASAAYASGGGYLLAEVELLATFGTAPTANTGVALWFLRAIDGTNYEDGSATVTPARAADVVLPVRAVTTAQRTRRVVLIPPGTFKGLAMNDGTGQALAATGNIIRLLPLTYQQ